MARGTNISVHFVSNAVDNLVPGSARFDYVFCCITGSSLWGRHIEKRETLEKTLCYRRLSIPA